MELGSTFFKSSWIFFTYFFIRANIEDDWTFDEFYEAYERVYIPGSKTAVFYSQDIFNNVIASNLHRTEPPTLLKDHSEVESRSFAFKPFHFFFDVFDRKLQQYVEADLISYNSRKWNEENDPKGFQRHKKPFAVLSLEKLEAGFVVCVLPFAFSIFVFGVEWIVTLKDLAVFIIIFKNYFAAKKREQNKRGEILKVKFAALKAILETKMLEKEPLEELSKQNSNSS